MTPTRYPHRVRVAGGRVVHALTTSTRGMRGAAGPGGAVTWTTTLIAITACGRRLDLGPDGRSGRDGTLLPDGAVPTCAACGRRLAKETR